ncbi:MAG: hypothetical protein ACLPTZ_07445 [Beijerinckiaceae bacterium]|jgi:hypothetical protein
MNDCTLYRKTAAGNGLVEVPISPPNRWREFADALRPCNLGDTPSFDLDELVEMKDELLDWACYADEVAGAVESAGDVTFLKADVRQMIAEFISKGGIDDFMSFLSAIVMLRHDLLAHAEEKAAEYEKQRAAAS